MYFKKIRFVFIFILVALCAFFLIYRSRRFKEQISTLYHSNTQLIQPEYLGEEGVIFQKGEDDCGIAALKMILDHYHIKCSYEEISENVGRDKYSDMLSLKEFAELKGLRTEGWRFNQRNVKKMKVPAIALVDNNHFVVLSEIAEEGNVLVLDPARGKLSYSQSGFASIWNGEALIFELAKK